MTEYVLYSIIVMTLSVLYIVYKKGIETLFDKLCSLYLVYAFVHAAFTIIALKILLLSEIEIVGSPFIFGYGPFFIMGLKSLTDKMISKKFIYINCIPAVVFGLLYIVILTGDKNWISLSFNTFFIVECSFVIISVLGYAFWAMYITRPTQYEKESNILKEQFIKTGAFCFILMGALFAVAAIAGVILEKNISGEVIGLILFSGILISIMLAFIFEVNNITNTKSVSLPVVKEPLDIFNNNIMMEDRSKLVFNNAAKENKTDKIKQNPIPVQKYNKSALSPAVLEDYKEKLQRLIHVEKVYLDNELTLEVLAKKIKMPMHHLTQLFNVHLGENFNQYINKYRIGHAKSLLEDNYGMLSIEQIAFNSGFNSKVSFNRHFKILTGYTPKEYASGAGDME